MSGSSNIILHQFSDENLKAKKPHQRNRKDFFLQNKNYINIIINTQKSNTDLNKSDFIIAKRNCERLHRKILNKVLAEYSLTTDYDSRKSFQSVDDWKKQNTCSNMRINELFQKFGFTEIFDDDVQEKNDTNSLTRLKQKKSPNKHNFKFNSNSKSYYRTFQIENKGLNRKSTNKKAKDYTESIKETEESNYEDTEREIQRQKKNQNKLKENKDKVPQKRNVRINQLLDFEDRKETIMPDKEENIELNKELNFLSKEPITFSQPAKPHIEKINAMKDKINKIGGNSKEKQEKNKLLMSTENDQQNFLFQKFETQLPLPNQYILNGKKILKHRLFNQEVKQNGFDSYESFTPMKQEIKLKGRSKTKLTKSSFDYTPPFQEKVDDNLFSSSNKKNELSQKMDITSDSKNNKNQLLFERKQFNISSVCNENTFPETNSKFDWFLSGPHQKFNPAPFLNMNISKYKEHISLVTHKYVYIMRKAGTIKDENAEKIYNYEVKVNKSSNRFLDLMKKDLCIEKKNRNQSL